MCLGFDEPDRAAAVADRLVVDGRTWMSDSRWHGEDVLRISVSNWATSAADVQQAVDSVRHALVDGHLRTESP